jgi:thioesterase domain-containing protein
VTDIARADHPRVEDLAAWYVAEVRAVQPEGPYFLGGLSFGGIVLFEMAQQLCAVGMSDSLFDPALGDIDPQLGWGRVVAGGVEVYEVAGEHVSIFREPNVRSLAEKLTNCLEMARETALR